MLNSDRLAQSELAWGVGVFKIQVSDGTKSGIPSSDTGSFGSETSSARGNKWNKVVSRIIAVRVVWFVGCWLFVSLKFCKYRTRIERRSNQKECSGGLFCF